MGVKTPAKSDWQASYIKVEYTIGRPISEVWPVFVDIRSWITDYRIEAVEWALNDPMKVGAISKVTALHGEAPDNPKMFYAQEVLDVIPGEEIVLWLTAEHPEAFDVRDLSGFYSWRLTDAGGKTRITIESFDSDRPLHGPKDHRYGSAYRSWIGNLRTLEKTILNREPEAVDAFYEGRMEWNGHRTWYRVVGDIRPGSGLTPLVICHGGPGGAHDYCEPIAELSRAGRGCVLYDQLGCGRSQHLPNAPADFWTPQLFKDELAQLLRHLDIQDRYSVIGHSWGGMLAMEHALDHPHGLRSIIVADAPASMTHWISEANRLRADLPPDVQETLTRQVGTTAHPEYEQAEKVYYDRHVCRLPWPDCLQRSFAQIREDPTVYHTMHGPSEFHCIGSLRDWDITDRLHEIDVPTLLVSGRHDEATPLIVGQIHERIPGANWTIFEQSSHVPHIEEPETFLQRLEQFLATID
jgi:L-proline amide hydrolase